jgi:hypothetical protein
MKRGSGRDLMAAAKFPGLQPLILSFSLREKEPLNRPQRKFKRSFSQGEKDRVRGVAASDVLRPSRRDTP